MQSPPVLYSTHTLGCDHLEMEVLPYCNGTPAKVCTVDIVDVVGYILAGEHVPEPITGKHKAMDRGRGEEL